jgi:hypothetical protein
MLHVAPHELYTVQFPDSSFVVENKSSSWHVAEPVIIPVLESHVIDMVVVQYSVPIFPQPTELQSSGPDNDTVAVLVCPGDDGRLTKLAVGVPTTVTPGQFVLKDTTTSPKLQPGHVHPVSLQLDFSV